MVWRLATRQGMERGGDSPWEDNGEEDGDGKDLRLSGEPCRCGHS
jgi:hypothetical protein